jgi:hypothetical protein
MPYVYSSEQILMKIHPNILDDMTAEALGHDDSEAAVENGGDEKAKAAAAAKVLRG